MYGVICAGTDLLRLFSDGGKEVHVSSPGWWSIGKVSQCRGSRWSRSN